MNPGLQKRVGPPTESAITPSQAAGRGFSGATPLASSREELLLERFLRAQGISAMLANLSQGINERLEALASELSDLFPASRVTVSIVNGMSFDSQSTSKGFDNHAEHCFSKDISVEGEYLGCISIESVHPISQIDHRLLDQIVDQAGWSVATAEKLVELEKKAYTDDVTGLPNRRAFSERCAQLVEQIDRYGGNLFIIYADVDHFKKVNDEQGHLGGNEALCTIADILRDIAGQDAFREGDDEFVMLALDPQRALRMAVLLQEKVKQAGFDMSVGIVQRKLGETFKSFMARADVKMYMAKNHVVEQQAQPPVADAREQVA